MTSHHCTHLHREVTQHDGLCWLRLEGDPERMEIITHTIIGYSKGGMPTGGTVPRLLGWDTCRAKHIAPKEASK